MRRSTAASMRWSRSGAARGGAAGGRGGRIGHRPKALGFDELLVGDIERMKRRTRNYARRQLTWMRKLAA